ncbi:MAG: hypothetical protein KC457_01040 [Myxococcales bacterium]|nr:hypothetical protein [Myxococcales bacterium]
MQTRLVPLFFALALALPLAACEKGETTNPDQGTAQAQGDGQGEEHGEAHDDAKFEGREVVDNWKAQNGDVTVCPISGKKFEVSDASGRWDYEGHSFVFCCDGACLDKVKADPDKYLGELVQQAQAQAGDAPEEPAATE